VTTAPTPLATLDALAGDWIVERRLEPGIGTFAGSARFVPAADGALDYREDGELRLSSGWTGPATRRQRWIAADDAVEVRFAGDLRDGELLHRLVPTATGTTGDVHLCGADLYTGDYDFSRADEVRIAMDVRGPEKDYRAVTVLRRARPPLPA
jgi:hypothetical protein